MNKQATSQTLLWGAKIPWAVFAYFAGCATPVLGLLFAFQAICFITHFIIEQS